MDFSSRKKERWLSRHFGTRRGFIHTYWHRCLYFLGKYDKYKCVDWSSVERIVFICKGNICRSAYAEAVARSLDIDAISCGLDTIEGARANSAAVQEAERCGFDIEGHRTRPVMYTLLKSTDLIVAMEPWQCVFLEKNLTRKHSCTLLGLWSKPVLPHIQDPYNTPDEYFHKCFGYITDSVGEIARRLKSAS